MKKFYFITSEFHVQSKKDRQDGAEVMPPKTGILKSN